MYVTEHLERSTNPLFSFEIVPPLRGRSARDILDIVEHLMKYEPPFIDVTAHGAVAEYREDSEGTIHRRIHTKRPGTLSLCGIIQNRYNMDTVPHLLCRGFTREETEDAMIELAFLGIHNVLAVRGDETNYQTPSGDGRTVNRYTQELVGQLSDLRSGKYLGEIDNSDPMDLCIGVGAYPEKHVEAPSLKVDIARLKEKVEAGADYIVTQMFFDNQRFFEFERRCREASITVPIIPGLKVVNSVRQLQKLPKFFHISLPDDLVDEIMETPKQVKEIGVRWATEQARGLLEHGVKCIHFFVVNDVKSVCATLDGLS